MPHEQDRLNIWLSLSNIYSSLNETIEQALMQQYELSLTEFYVLHFIYHSEEKKLRLQHLQEMIGLSQSATSRLVVRMEAKNCGSLERHVCDNDRRGIYTRITEFGEQKYKNALQLFNEALATGLSRAGLKDEVGQLTNKLF